MREGERPVDEPHLVRVVSLDKLQRWMQAATEGTLEICELDDDDRSLGGAVGRISRCYNIRSQGIQEGCHFEGTPRIVQKHVAVLFPARIDHVLADLWEGLGLWDRYLRLVRFVECLDLFGRRR